MSQISRRQATTLGTFAVALLAVLWILFGALNAQDPARQGQLLAMLGPDADVSARLGAVTALAGPAPTPEVVEALKGALVDVDVRVRASAAWSLWRSGLVEEATVAFDLQLAAADTADRQAALAAIRSLESPATSILLRRASGDPTPGIRTQAALGLIRINDEAGFTILSTALSDVRPGHRIAAVRALARVDDSRAVELARRLASTGPSPANALAEVLLLHWTRIDADGAKALTAALADAGDPVRADLCRVMGHLLTYPQFEAIPGAISLTQAPTPASVRTACTQAQTRTKTARR